MSTSSIGDQQLRAVIRQTLTEILGPGGDKRLSNLIHDTNRNAPQQLSRQTDMFVRVNDDTELGWLVHRVIELCADPHQRQALSQGTLRFRLADSPPPLSPNTSTPGQPIAVDKGAITEAVVRRAAKTGSRLLLGPRAVMTPLAREAAQSLGVVVEMTPK